MSNKRLKIAVTGTTGFVGSRLCRYFMNEGEYVIQLKRRITPEEERSGSSRYFELENSSQTDFSDIDVLIHCAYDMKETNWKKIRRTNIQGTLDLIDASLAQGVKRFIFISSIACFEGCRSNYGKSKLMLEKEVLKRGCLVVRPGLVYGGGFPSMYGRLYELAGKSPFLPLMGTGDYPLFLCHHEDLSRFIHELVYMNEAHGVYTAASPQVVTLKSLLRSFISEKMRACLLMPIPWQPIWALLKVAESIGINLGVKSDGLITLVYAPASLDWSGTMRMRSKFREYRCKSI